MQKKTYKQVLKQLIQKMSKLKHSQWYRWNFNIHKQMSRKDFNKDIYMQQIQKYFVDYEQLPQQIINIYDTYQYNNYKQVIQPSIKEMAQIVAKDYRVANIHLISLLTRLFKQQSKLLKFQGKYYINIDIEDDGQLLYQIDQNDLKYFDLTLVNVLSMRQGVVDNNNIIKNLTLTKLLSHNINNLTEDQQDIIRNYQKAFKIS